MTPSHSLRLTLGALTAALALAAPSQAAPPGNDQLADASTLSGFATQINSAPYTTVGATREAAEADHYEQLAGHTVWMKWTPKYTGGTFVRSCGENGAPYSALDVYKGPANATHAQLTQLQIDSPWKFPTCEMASQTFMATAGTTYFFVFDHMANSAAGPGRLELHQEIGAPVSTFVGVPAEGGPQFKLTWKANSTAKEPSWQCRLDGEPIDGCGKVPSLTLNGLSGGKHTFEVRATDWYGNVESSWKSTTFVVDALGPDTVLTSGPPAPAANSAAFTFKTSEPGATFVCTQDGSKPYPCVSPYAWKGTIWTGTHTFTVAALDKYGNADPTPAVMTWKHETPQLPLPPKPPVPPAAPPVQPPQSPQPPVVVPPTPAEPCPVAVPEVALRRALLSGAWRVGGGPCRATFTLRLGRRVLARTTAPAGRTVRVRLRGTGARALRRAPRLARLTVAVSSRDARGVVHRLVRRPVIG